MNISARISSCCLLSSRSEIFREKRWQLFHHKDERRLFSVTALKRVNNLSVAFCYRNDVPLTMLNSNWEAESADGRRSFENMSLTGRIHFAHLQAHALLYISWVVLTATLKGFSPPLQKIEIDLTNAYCPFGSCRCLYLIDFSFLKVLTPKIVRVIGLRGGEQHTLKSKLEEDGLMTDKHGERCELPFILQCDPQDDPSAKHKRLPTTAPTTT
jgi:hypothetical protein